jgi:prepilin-type N-terminal cleavage/methylation domain-containing protein
MKLKSISIKNFTLVELLVVIAIIAILASMLLPTLGRARELGKRINCVGQMKQIGVAAMNYVNDFDGYWAAWHQDDGKSPATDIQRGQWMTILAEYVGGNGLLWICPTAKFGDRQDMYEILKTSRAPYGSASRWRDPMFHVQTIGINGLRFNRNHSTNKLRDVKSLSKLIYAMDNVGNNNAYSPRNSNGGRYCNPRDGSTWPEYTSGHVVNPCHLNTANILFAEGHVESIGRPELRIMGSTEANTYWRGL